MGERRDEVGRRDRVVGGLRLIDEGLNHQVPALDAPDVPRVVTLPAVLVPLEVPRPGEGEGLGAADGGARAGRQVEASAVLVDAVGVAVAVVAPRRARPCSRRPALTASIRPKKLTTMKWLIGMPSVFSIVFTRPLAPVKADPGHLDRILQGEEQPGPATATTKAASTSSWPSILMLPDVTVVPGRPISACAKVLLPEPLYSHDQRAPHRCAPSGRCRAAPQAHRPRRAAHAPRRRGRSSRQHHADVIPGDDFTSYTATGWVAGIEHGLPSSTGRRCCRAGRTRSHARPPTPHPRPTRSPRGCTGRPTAWNSSSVRAPARCGTRPPS